MKCTLDRDINECDYFDHKTLKCNNPNKCSFQEENNYIIYDENGKRKEKWFEKYYK